MSIQSVNLFAIPDKPKRNNKELAFKSDCAIFEDSIKYGNYKAQNSLGSKLVTAASVGTLSSIALLYACKQPGKLSNKLLAGGNILGLFALMGGLWGGIRKFANIDVYVGKNNENKKEELKPTVFGTLAQIGLLAGTTLLSLFAMKKGANLISKNHPEFAKSVKNKFNMVADKIDNSYFGTKTESLKQEFDTFRQNNRKQTEFLSQNSIPLIILGYIATVLGLNSKIKSDRNTNIVDCARNLYNERENARKEIAQG